MGKEYGQFCGLARAAEVVGERWTLLILRDLSVGPARFSQLRSGLPGIAATMLTARLRDLEDEGLVARSDDQAAYALTARGRSLVPALQALSRWGAATMAGPRPGEQATDRSLAAMLDTARTSRRVAGFVVEVRAGDAVAHARVDPHGVAVSPGPAGTPDLVLGGPGLRQALAQPERLADLVAAGAVTAQGPHHLLPRFARAFRVPLDDGDEGGPGAP